MRHRWGIGSQCKSYSSTQLDFALAYLGANKRKTRLATLSLGANDGFQLIAACNNDPACIQANLPAALGAGLLNGNPANQTACDLHPSITGQRLLAKTVQTTYRALRRGDD